MFNKLFNILKDIFSPKYYKIFNEKENHNGFQYKDGLNIDNIPFNDNSYDSCCEGGLYFSDRNNISDYFNYGSFIRKVSVPNGNKIIKDPRGDKYRAHTLFLEPRHDLRNVDTWRWMDAEGIVIDINSIFNEFIINNRYNNIFDVIKYFCEDKKYSNPIELNKAFKHMCTTTDINSIEYLFNKVNPDQNRIIYVLNCVCQYHNVMAPVTFLIKHLDGATIFNNQDQILYSCIINGNFDVAEYLLENGFNFTKSCKTKIKLNNCKGYSKYNEINDFIKKHKPKY